MNNATGRNGSPVSSKKPRLGPAIFVERTLRKKASRRLRESTPGATNIAQQPLVEAPGTSSEPVKQQEEQTEGKTFKRPGVANRKRGAQENPIRTPLPDSLSNRHGEDMSRITADMNEWVINEIGASLESMDQEAKATQNSRFRPKAPTQRFRDRHPGISAQPEPTTPSNAPAVDTMSIDGSDDDADSDDWIIEEYIRIPVKSMAIDVSASDIGVLVLDGEEATALFYGPENDEDDEYAEDDEDENGKYLLARGDSGAMPRKLDIVLCLQS